MSPKPKRPAAGVRLLGDGLEVRGAGITARELSARGARPATGRRRRGPGLPAATPADPLDRVLAATGMRVSRVVELQPAAPARRRRGAPAVAPSGATPVDLEVDAPPAGFGQVVLSVDELGVARWHLPEAASAATRRRRGAAPAGTRVYRVVVGGVRPSGRAPRRRGLVGGLVKAVVKVLLFPITDAVLGPIEHLLAKHWEKKHTPYGLRSFTPDDYTTPVRGGLKAADWRALAGGPALLFVHGTFSTSHGAFSRLSASDVRALHAAYEGRVFAFDHHSVSDTPQDNVKAFGELLPEGVQLEVDIVCHSRGGLVSRTLACAGDALIGRGRVKVRRIVFVASPNDGTALADGAHMTKMLDRYTGVTRFLPDGPVEVAAELVVTAVKALASAGLKGLPGLAAQSPDSDFLKWLRRQPVGDTEFYGVSADFEPSSPQWQKLVLEQLENAVMDDVFGKACNDLVVPTAGVCEATKGPGFPVTGDRSLRVGPGGGVIHTNMFGDRTIVDTIRGWLGAGGGRRGIARTAATARAGGRSRRAAEARATQRGAGVRRRRAVPRAGAKKRSTRTGAKKRSTRAGKAARRRPR